jgi:hypothetical protein
LKDSTVNFKPTIFYEGARTASVIPSPFFNRAYICLAPLRYTLKNKGIWASEKSMAGFSSGTNTLYPQEIENPLNVFELLQIL